MSSRTTIEAESEARSHPETAPRGRVEFVEPPRDIPTCVGNRVIRPSLLITVIVAAVLSTAGELRLFNANSIALVSA
jgi:hypothetical protein